MDVVLFCGGRGTRLSEKTKETPKPLVEIGEYPILWHIMKILSHYNHNRFILTLGYKGDLIKQWFLNYRFTESFELDLSNPTIPDHIEDWKIVFKNTGLESGTGYRLLQVKDDIKTGRFMVLYGDCLADVNIRELVDYHDKMVKEKGILVTVSGFQPKSKYGVIKHESSGVITEFVEKPKTSDWVNIGFMVCENKVFDYIPDQESIMFEDGPLHRLADEGKLALYKHEGVFHPMDTYKDYSEINALWFSGKAKWKKWKD